MGFASSLYLTGSEVGLSLAGLVLLLVTAWTSAKAARAITVLAVVALFGAAGLMAVFPDYAHLIFGVVSAACFFIPGLKYYRQRVRANRNSG